MTQTATQIKVQVGTLSIYSTDAGGRNGRQGIHKDAIVLAYQWGLLRGDLNPSFDGYSNLVRVPEGMTATLSYSENEFTLVLAKGDDKKIVVRGTQVEPATNNPQQWGGHTVYTSDAKGFSFSFHGHLITDPE